VNGRCTSTCPTLGGEQRRNLALDANDWVTCGVQCRAGTRCVSGVCACPPSTTLCVGALSTFADRSIDWNNCGVCSRACAINQRCGGVCVAR
jgi:hypothetical protein